MLKYQRVTRHINIYLLISMLTIGCLGGCSKKTTGGTPVVPPVTPSPFSFKNVTVNGVSAGAAYYNTNFSPVIKFTFSSAIDHNSVSGSFSFKDLTGTSVSYNTSFEHNDSVVVIQPAAALKPITSYVLAVSTSLQAQDKGQLLAATSMKLITAIDSSDKFQQISDSALLTLIQQQTFKYF